jgi:hypothetical protein
MQGGVIITGKFNNIITQGDYAAVVGGEKNTVQYFSSVVLGGSGNNEDGYQSVLLGGLNINHEPPLDTGAQAVSAAGLPGNVR